MAKSKKPPAAFEVYFQRKGLYPEDIPLGNLTTALSAIRRLATGSEAPDEDEEEAETTLPEDGSIRLLDVHRGSAAFRFVAPIATVSLEHLKEAGKVLVNPDTFAGEDFILRPVDLLSRIARSLNCSILVRSAGPDRAVFAQVEPDSYNRIAGRLFLTGETAVSGRVQRIGGATKNRCALRVSFQSRLLYCGVANEEVARQLGNYLYQDVTVRGKARWLRNTWRVLELKIESVSQPRTGSPVEAFQALRKAGGDGWDEIDDPEAFLEEVNGQ